MSCIVGILNRAILSLFIFRVVRLCKIHKIIPQTEFRLEMFLIIDIILLLQKHKYSVIYRFKLGDLKRKFRYKRQLARPRCHSVVNQQRTRQELVIR